MEQQAIFKKRFRGFDKAQVLSYIDGLTADYHKTLAEREAEINDLQAALDEKISQAEALCNERDAAVKKFEEKLAEHNRALDAMKNLGEEYGRLKKEAAEKNTRLRECESRLTVYETDRLKNEFTKKQIADAYIAAQQGAKDILENARKEADKETSAARRERDFLLAQVGKLRDEVERLKDRLKGTLDEIEDRVDEFQLHFEGFEDAVGALIPEQPEPDNTPDGAAPQQETEQAAAVPNGTQPQQEPKTVRLAGKPSVRVHTRPAGRGLSEKVSDVFKKWL